MINQFEIHCEPFNIKIDFDKSLFLIIDMQNLFCNSINSKKYIVDNLIPKINSATYFFRKNKVQIMWLNWGLNADLSNIYFNQINSGTSKLIKGAAISKIHKDLIHLDSDLYVDKHRISGFYDNHLESILCNLGISNIFFAGVNTDQCVLHTLSDAYFRGYNCTLIEDCTFTSSPEFCYQSAIWNIKKCFGTVTKLNHVINGVLSSES